MDAQPQFNSQQQLLADLRGVLALGVPALNNGHRPDAKLVLERYQNFPLPDEDEERSPEEEELDRLGQELWDILYPVEEPINWHCIDAVEWLEEALTWLAEHYGTLAKFEKQDDPEEQAVLDQLHGLDSRRYFINADSIPEKREAEFWTVCLAIEDHADPDRLLASVRRRNFYAAKGWNDPGDFPRVELECSKEFEARIELLQEHGGGKFISAYREVKGRDPVPDDYLSPVEHLEWLRNPITSIVRQVGPTAEDIEEAHQQIKELVDGGSGASEVQKFINGLQGFNQSGLAKYADSCREELERQQDLADALEDLLLRGAPPTIALQDYLPEGWLPMFRVLREGMKFTDEAIAITVMAGVAAMFPPRIRVAGWSMEEIPTVWVFHIGTSGSAKSVLLRKLITGPMHLPMEEVDRMNAQDLEDRKAEDSKRQDGETGVQVDQKDLPPFRKRNLIYTAPTTQGIRADLAMHGAQVPGLLVRDELNGWLKQMGDEAGAGVGDVEFWLSSYDGAYSNDVFADSRKSREVRQGKLAVIGGIQPKVFLEQLEAGNANGFNSRPLFVHLPRIKRELMKDDEQTEKLADQLGELYLEALQCPFERFALDREAEELFDRLFNQLEDLSMQAGSEEVEALWAKGPGQVLRMAAAVQFLRNSTDQEQQQVRGFKFQTVKVSARSLQLAANLVMAGKTRAVELHERASNPMLERADKLLESARKRQGKSGAKGVRLSEIRKGWDSRTRPTLTELKQMAVMLQSRGMVQLLDQDRAIRVVR